MRKTLEDSKQRRIAFNRKMRLTLGWDEHKDELQTLNVDIDLARLRLESHLATCQHSSGTSTASDNTTTVSRMSRLLDIAAIFQSDILPDCQALLSCPPADNEKRIQEQHRLQIAIEQNVLWSYDRVRSKGDEVIRHKRKELIKEAQEWSNRLGRLVPEGET